MTFKTKKNRMLNPCFTDGGTTNLGSIYHGGYRCLYFLVWLPAVESRDGFKGQDKITA